MCRSRPAPGGPRGGRRPVARAGRVFIRSGRPRRPRRGVNLLALLLALACVAAAAAPRPVVIEALSNVKGALHKAYDLKDSTGLQMASLHLLPQTEGAGPAERTYHAAYMSMLPKSLWEVRVANSSNLMHWAFHKKILPDADMPYAFPLPNGWILLAHEQWMRTSPGPG